MMLCGWQVKDIIEQHHAEDQGINCWEEQGWGSHSSKRSHQACSHRCQLVKEEARRDAIAWPVEEEKGSHGKAYEGPF